MEAKMSEMIAALNTTGMKSTTPPARADRTAAERSRRYRQRRKLRNRSAAERSRRYRQRQSGVTASTDAGPPPSRQPAPISVTDRRRRGLIPCVTMLAALAVAAVSGSFSVIGLSAVFVGSFWPIVGMGAALECAKLSAVAWLGRSYTASRSLKVATGALIVTLMGLNAIGSYGYLAKAHIDHAVAGEAQVADHKAHVEARRELAAANIADLDRRIGQIDGAIAEATKRGRTSSAMTLTEHQAGRRNDLVADRARAASALAAVEVETAGVENERAEQVADFGPLEYLSKLIGADRDAVMRWFVLCVACLLDPLAITLLLAASRADFQK
jgi:hypothetical protein